MADYHDTFNFEGASRVAKKIRNYWAKRGFIVNTRLEPMGATIYFDEHSHRQATMRAAYAVRSDLVNGMPQVKMAEAA